MLGEGSLTFPMHCSFEIHQIHCISINLQRTSHDVFPEGNVHRLAKIFATTVTEPRQRLQKEFDSLLMYRPKVEFTINVSSHHVGPCSKSTLGVYIRAIKKKLGRPVPSDELQKYVIGQEKGKTRWVHTTVDDLLRFKSNITPGNDMVAIINGADRKDVGPIAREEVPHGGGESSEEAKRMLDRNDVRRQNDEHRSRQRSRDRSRSRSRTVNRDGPRSGHGRDTSRSRESERRSLSYEPNDRYRHWSYGRHRHSHLPRNFGRRGNGTRYWEK